LVTLTFAFDEGVDDGDFFVDLGGEFCGVDG
jgi:hypothetical protein